MSVPCDLQVTDYINLMIRTYFVYAGELCQIQNVAHGKPAKQSSTDFDGHAVRAVDGNRNTDFDNGSCTHTELDQPSHWWRVDLRYRVKVINVTITNRNDTIVCK